jgi:hypothetical protein
LELNEYEDTNLLTTCKNYSLLGLETEHPLLKIDDLLFQGTYEESVGTILLFEMNTSQQENEPPLKYVAHTTRRLVFRRVTLVPRSCLAESEQPAHTHVQQQSQQS